MLTTLTRTIACTVTIAVLATVTGAVPEAHAQLDPRFEAKLDRRIEVEIRKAFKRYRYLANAPAQVVDNVDPEGTSRVRVRFPWLPDEADSVWARMSAPQAGSGEGMYWLPEIGDEVLVSFLHGDLRQPVVLGRLFNGSDRPESCAPGKEACICAETGT